MSAPISTAPEEDDRDPKPIQPSTSDGPEDSPETFPAHRAIRKRIRLARGAVRRARRELDRNPLVPLAGHPSRAAHDGIQSVITGNFPAYRKRAVDEERNRCEGALRGNRTLLNRLRAHIDQDIASLRDEEKRLHRKLSHVPEWRDEVGERWPWTFLHVFTAAKLVVIWLGFLAVAWFAVRAIVESSGIISPSMTWIVSSVTLAGAEAFVILMLALTTAAARRRILFGLVCALVVAVALWVLPFIYTFARPLFEDPQTTASTTAASERVSVIAGMVTLGAQFIVDILIAAACGVALHVLHDLHRGLRSTMHPDRLLSNKQLSRIHSVLRSAQDTAAQLEAFGAALNSAVEACCAEAERAVESAMRLEAARLVPVLHALYSGESIIGALALASHLRNGGKPAVNNDLNNPNGNGQST